MFGWLGRKALIYMALVAAIGMATMGLPWIKQRVEGVGRPEIRAVALQTTQTWLSAEKARAKQDFAAHARALANEGAEVLNKRIGDLTEERRALQADLRAAPPRWRLALSGADAVIAVERKKLRLAWVEQELPVATAARDARLSQDALATAVPDMQRQRDAWRRSLSSCREANRALRAYEATWKGKIARWWETADHRRLAGARDARCAAAARDGQQLEILIKAVTASNAARRAALDVYRKAATFTGRQDAVGSDLAAEAAKARTAWEGGIGRKLPTLLWQAAIALAVIIAMPLLIRLFCYFVLAPAAMRRASIRLRVPGGSGRAIPLADRSTTSVGVRLEPGEELLIRQDYLQSGSLSGSYGTQWFLDWRHPITSLGTGLTFLTRVRGGGEVTTVSTVKEPWAEVTVLALPDGASCVLQPRALAAVAQPIDRPLRVTTHWRLGSLNAWLTLQLRYIVFHGPVRLVVKGGRGVRVERAERGRVFGQDQLVGFSADLAYSVTRTETFWPYFVGRAQLLKDRVEAGEGLLIVEEAPLSSRSGNVRRGLEGMVDAGMKVFGM